MTTHKLIQLLESINKKIEASKTIAFASHASILYHRILPIYAARIDRELYTEEAKTFSDNLSNFEELLKELNAKDVFLEITDLQKDLNDLSSNLSVKGLLYNLKSQLNVFEEYYETYFKERNTLNRLHLLNSSASLNIAASSFHEVTSFIILSINQNDKIPLNDNERSLAIFLDSDSQLTNFIIKITALKLIYEELCRIFDISTLEFPLKIIRLEYGSVWAKLFGESKIIALMTKFCEETASYFYRTKTAEGRRKENSVKATELKQLLDLENELKEKGFDTTKMREDIQKASQVISQEYLTLLSGSSSVEINGKEFNFNDGKSRNLFAITKEPLQLEDGSQKEDEKDRQESE
ncbi:MAG: hypothetical protein AAB336_04500 [Acidobacteriota bacterium]